MDLPSAPLSALPAAASPPPPPPAWTGYADAVQTFADLAKHRGNEAPPAAPEHPLITREQLQAHLVNPAAWRSLPDGRPLRLQAEGMEYIIDDFGGFNGTELRSAHRLLYFATRTEADMRALWIPPVPAGDDDSPQEGLALHMRALQAEIGAWASATFEPSAYREVLSLAVMLWQAIMDRLPVSGEKKNPQSPARELTPDSSSPTSATSAGLCPEAMPSATSSSSSAPTSAPSSPPSSDGAISTSAAPSPCLNEPAVSPPPAP